MNWHTFRLTYSTLLHGNGEDPKVAQELLRHSSIKVTMEIYTQAGRSRYQAQGPVSGDRNDRSEKKGGDAVAPTWR
jgi:integrase